MPVLCLIFAVACAGWQQSWQRWLAHGLVGLSIVIHGVVGLFGYSGYAEWQKRHSDLGGASLFEWHDTQIEAHTRALVKKLLGRKSAPTTGQEQMLE
jgi:hypothetical protein